MPVAFDCPSCGQRLEVDCDEPSVLGSELTCPTCSFIFRMDERILHRKADATVAEKAPLAKDDANTGKWRSVVQECRVAPATVREG